jgi:pantoate--beta-alanine ligase
MQVVTSVSALRAARQALQGTVGFVPTMGYLHEGHLALVRRARAENDAVVVSIYVNPLQFGPREDFATYPRDLPRDLALLEKEGTDLVFAPTDAEMYPIGYSTYVEVTGVTEVLEGAMRPGHFKGVTTVVAKLFNLVQPTRAYFGQKDAQQCVVIRKMVADLNMPLEVVVCPTVREEDGLAMSSRNTYLSPEERKAATVLYRALMHARDLYRAGERSGDRLRAALRQVLGSESLVTTVDYVSVADPDTLQELERVEERALLSLAVRIGRTRLIDNILLPEATTAE